MSLLDLASLVLAPTATKEGKVYSAIPNMGDGDMTFSRGSAATRVNSAGLIEKERANLLLQSNTFDTTWSGSVSVASGYAGYDNSNDAWLLSKGAGQYLSLVSGSLSNSGVQTYSIYCKAATLNLVTLFVSYSGSNKYVEFDLTDGSVNAQTSSGIIDSGSTSMGNGWYRLYMTINEAVTGVRVYPDWINSVAGGVYIQDAMLNQGLVAQSYIETTTSAVYEGITDDVPRVDYSGGGCPSLLLEPQRSNLNDQSEYFNGWSKANATVTDNAIISPEGVQNGSLVECTSGRIQKNISLTSGTTYVISLFAKANGDYFTVQVLDGTNPATQFNLSTESTSDSNGATSTIEEFGNGWYRCTMKFTSAYTGATTIRGITSTDTNGVYVYGWQLEAGSYSTSYIPTYGVSSTRVADFFLKSNASNLIGQTEGTIFIEFTRENNSVGTFSISANNVGTRIYIGTNATGLICQVRNGYAQQAYFSTAQTEGTKYKCAIAYATNDFVLYMNGTQIGTETSGTVPACNTIRTDDAGGSNLNQPLSQAILFPTRLTNDQLADLTTL